MFKFECALNYCPGNISEKVKELILCNGECSVADLFSVPVLIDVSSDRDHGWTELDLDYHFVCDLDRENCKYICNVEFPDPHPLNHDFQIATTEEPQIDLVNHPGHYQSKNGLEVIDVIDAFTEGIDGPEAAYTANVIKYICRWKKKNGLEDLKKAQWYLNRLIISIESK